MNDYFSIGEAAKATHTTRETLRHYDRIGLIHPSKKDECTNYRYYTEQDLLRIHTVRALQQMDLPLQKIKEVLEFDALEKIIDFLTAAEKRADEKIASLQYSKAKLQLAKTDYETQLSGRNHTEGITLKQFPKRIILLSDTLESPTLENLWNYLSHFYAKLEPLQKEHFEFENVAGLYTEPGCARLFAVCMRYLDMEGLKELPEGTYLCVDCTEETRTRELNHLMQIAKEDYHTQPEFSVQQILVSGILQWNYQVQVYLGQ